MIQVSVSRIGKDRETGHVSDVAERIVKRDQHDLQKQQKRRFISSLIRNINNDITHDGINGKQAEKRKQVIVIHFGDQPEYDVLNDQPIICPVKRTADWQLADIVQLGKITGNIDFGMYQNKQKSGICIYQNIP